MIEDLVALNERINEGIDDVSLVELVRLLVPSNDSGLFEKILQQNSDLGRKTRQERTLTLYFKEVGDCPALQVC